MRVSFAEVQRIERTLAEAAQFVALFLSAPLQLVAPRKRKKGSRRGRK